MREMKDSGIEIFKKIPYDWKTKRLKYLFSFCKGLPITKENLIEIGLPVISYGQIHSKSNNGVEIQSHLLRYVDFSYQNSYPTSQVFRGDFVFADTSEDYDGCGNCVYKRDDKVLFAGYHAIIAHSNQKSDNRFLAYLFQTDNWRKQIREKVSGVKVFSITQKTLANIYVILPPPDEQQKIAEFLDGECEKIDGLTRDIQAEIETLEQYKRSVITEAVTKGLNPDVSMKDSGDSFIGVMPEHWNVAKLGMLFDFLGGYAYNSDSYTSESDNQVIRIGNVKSGYMALENNPVYISDEIASATDKFRISPGSILFTMTGTKGKRDYFFTHLVAEKDCKGKKLFLNQRVGCFIPKESIDAGYYNYLLKENRILDAIFVYETGTANQGNLGIESIRRTKVQLPSKDEQVKIREYLDNRCAKIEGLLTRKNEIICRLMAYKKSLIYEVVTGKKEV